MTRKTWIFIFLGILAAHGGLFLLIKDGPAIPPQWLNSNVPPEPTFKHGQASYIDPTTGEKMIVKEFTIKPPKDP